MPLEGKGFYIWKIPDCENGNPGAIATAAVQANLSHVLIKIADGTNSYNVDKTTGADLIPPVLQALRKNQIKNLGWHYVYGYDPVGEANKAIQRVKQLGLDGYVIDAEAEYKQPGKAEAARRFMETLRAGLPNLPIALSSYRYPSYHPQFPWAEFLEKCDYNMPQVYWMQNHNPGEQLARSVIEFQELTPFRPVIPVGAAFRERNWSPTPGDTTEFLNIAQTLNLSAANFYEWANCRRYLPDVWNAVHDYLWPTSAAPDITQQYISALNKHDPERVIRLYRPGAVHVTPERTIQGTVAIRAWYVTLFNQLLPGASFILSSFSGAGSSRHLSWTATSSTGSVQNGSDTFGLVEGKINYHFTSFKIT